MGPIDDNITYSAKGRQKKSLNFIFPIKYVIPQKSLKVSHWLSQFMIPVKWLNLFFQTPNLAVHLRRSILPASNFLKEPRTLRTDVSTEMCWDVLQKKTIGFMTLAIFLPNGTVDFHGQLLAKIKYISPIGSYGNLKIWTYRRLFDCWVLVPMVPRSRNFCDDFCLEL